MKAFFMRFIRNKFFVLVFAVIVLSIVYYGVDKALDGYYFDDNSNVSEEEIVDDLELEDFEESGEMVKEESELVDGDGCNGTEVSSGDDDRVEKVSESATEEEDTKNKIYVYITGEVVVPGVVILDEGSRISDAINAAGGTTGNANIAKVNLVYVLQDGMKVNIPNNSDLKNNPDFEYITTASGDGRNDVYTSNSISSSQNVIKEIVNINTATQTELESLPGIGPSLALKIINYRKENGSFSSIEDIKNVSGIGESKFEELKEYISV